MEIYNLNTIHLGRVGHLSGLLSISLLQLQNILIIIECCLVQCKTIIELIFPCVVGHIPYSIWWSAPLAHQILAGKRPTWKLITLRRPHLPTGPHQAQGVAPTYPHTYHPTYIPTWLPTYLPAWVVRGRWRGVGAGGAEAWGAEEGPARHSQPLEQKTDGTATHKGFQGRPGRGPQAGEK